MRYFIAGIEHLGVVYALLGGVFCYFKYTIFYYKKSKGENDVLDTFCTHFGMYLSICVSVNAHLSA
jgi:hypothetical protein